MTDLEREERENVERELRKLVGEGDGAQTRIVTDYELRCLFATIDELAQRAIQLDELLGKAQDDLYHEQNALHAAERAVCPHELIDSGICRACGIDVAAAELNASRHDVPPPGHGSDELPRYYEKDGVLLPVAFRPTEDV